jgi:uncharacterized protein
VSAVSRLSRRGFVGGGLALSAFGGLALRAAGAQAAPVGYGALTPDPAGLLDLPPGFSYAVLSQLGQRMDDGHLVPDAADGMGCIRLDRRRVALVRNHELRPADLASGPFGPAAAGPRRAFDRNRAGQALPGGTTTIIYNLAARQVESQHLSLVGTIRNCAGGVTPWGSWLSCEEDVTRANGEVGRDHGWVFEVPARRRGLAEPFPLVAMGRFNHEAAAVDPSTGIVYLTEDREDGLLYRFLPMEYGKLARGGRLQALAFSDSLDDDTRNWSAATMPVGAWRAVRWIDLKGIDSAEDDLRQRGRQAGAAVFARGEGIHVDKGDVFFCCTSGGAARLGQIMRLRPAQGDRPESVQLFVESDRPDVLHYGDNLTVAPNGHVIVCEDQSGDMVDNHIRGVSPAGAVYPLARLRAQTELAGACFSPDGAILFVNVFSPARTLAITGPWAAIGVG